MSIYDRVERYAPLEDIQIRNDGEGRTVEAYAAVFATRQEIRDREGHYLEELAPSSFDRTLSQRAGRLQVFFNHGLTIHGTPSDTFGMPLGTALEARADERGLFTVTQFARTPLADQVLELITSGAVRGMSFSGSFVKTRNGGKDTTTGLPVKTRTEVALREYGPTPFPAYAEARIQQVRGELDDLFAQLDTDDLVAHLQGLPDVERAVMLDALNTVPADTGTDTDPPTHLLGHVTHQRRQEVRRRIARDKGILL